MYHDSTVRDRGLEVICYGMLFDGKRGEPARRSTLGALAGWDNWGGVTVITNSVRTKDKLNASLNLLFRLPGLTTVVIFDGGAGTEKRPEVIEFKRRLQEKLPRVEVKHVHLYYPVG